MVHTVLAGIVGTVPTPPWHEHELAESLHLSLDSAQTVEPLG